MMEYVFEFQETRCEEGHILECTFDPKSKKEV